MICIVNDIRHIYIILLLKFLILSGVVVLFCLGYILVKNTNI